MDLGKYFDLACKAQQIKLFFPLKLKSCGCHSVINFSDSFNEYLLGAAYTRHCSNGNSKEPETKSL